MVNYSVKKLLNVVELFVRFLFKSCQYALFFCFLTTLNGQTGIERALQKAKQSLDNGQFATTDSLIQQIWTLPNLTATDSFLIYDFQQQKNILTEDFAIVHTLLEKTNNLLENKTTFSAIFSARLYTTKALLAILESDFKTAENLFKTVANYWQNIDNQHVWHADYLNHYGLFLTKLGTYEKAEHQFLAARKMSQSLNPIATQTYADATANLANLYRLLGDYDNALLFYEEVLLIVEKYGPVLEYATTLNNLGLVYDESDETEKAAAYYQQALTIYRTKLGTENLKYAGILNNLAGLYDYQENYEAAEPLYLEALTIIKKVVGEKHNYYTTMLSNLGILYEGMELPEKAIPLYREGLKIRQEILGKQHPKYVELLYNLAGALIQQNPTEATQLYREANTRQLELIHYYYSTFDEATRLEYLEAMELEFDRFFSLATLPDAPTSIVQDVQNFNLSLKGLSLDMNRDSKTQILEHQDSTTLALYQKWLTARERYGSTLIMSKVELEDSGYNRVQLKLELEQLEKQLARVTANTPTNNWSYTNIKNELSPNSASIDFVKFELFEDGFWTDSIVYYAIIGQYNWTTPKFVPICAEKDLETLLAASATYIQYPQLRAQLYQTVWQPLLPYLKDIQTIHLSATGLLHKLAFAGLADNNEVYLGKKYRFHFYSNLRDFLVPKSISKLTQATLLGGARYSTSPTLPNLNHAFIELPKTLEEVQGIYQFLDQKNWHVQLFTDTIATENNLKLNSNQGVLHLATHGFFFGKPNTEADESTTLRSKLKQNNNPLLRSGLILSGANAAWNGLSNTASEDGVLTAYEIANLDLRHTNLIVLSACETGLGDLHNEEGVFGLQRAFKMAGASNLIYSLWKIPDAPTALFMQRFYRNYLKHQDPTKALRCTQQKLAKKYSPFYWAGFVLIE